MNAKVVIALVALGGAALLLAGRAPQPPQNVVGLRRDGSFGELSPTENAAVTAAARERFETTDLKQRTIDFLASAPTGAVEVSPVGEIRVTIGGSTFFVTQADLLSNPAVRADLLAKGINAMELDAALTLAQQRTLELAYGVSAEPVLAFVAGAGSVLDPNLNASGLLPEEVAFITSHGGSVSNPTDVAVLRGAQQAVGGQSVWLDYYRRGLVR